MALRLGGLADLDAQTVPLPAGTDVVTRVDRDGVPKGAFGRVGVFTGDSVEVMFIDGRTARYVRSEIVPRKLGVVRYALRRAAAWEALRPCVVLETVVGSRAWGLSDEQSDEDRRGVFVLPFAWTTGLVDPPLDLLSEDGTHAHWEVGKAVRQALRADPNTLEMLFATPAVHDPMGEALVAHRMAFVSREIYGSFGRYALSQLDRLEHNQRLAAHRELVIGWLRDEPALSLDAAAERLVDAARVVAPTRKDAIARARDYLKQLYRSLYDQGLLATNEWSALRTVAAQAFELPRDLRPKNAYNLIRLLDSAIRWLGGEPPDVRASDALRPTLLSIKRGEVATDDVMALARELTPKLEAARQTSPLPEHADLATAEAILRSARSEAARRALAGVPGPFGRDAPAPPEPRYDE
jgi:RNA repair pathway DNA polymerase beta family